MKNVTLSVPDELLEKVREKAKSEKKVLNQLFREWLSAYIDQESKSGHYTKLMKRLKKISAGKKFSREDMNERQVFSRHQHYCLFI